MLIQFVFLTSYSLTKNYIIKHNSSPGLLLQNVNELFLFLSTQTPAKSPAFWDGKSTTVSNTCKYFYNLFWFFFNVQQNKIVNIKYSGSYIEKFL